MKLRFAKLATSANLSSKSISAIIGLIKSGKLKHGEKLPAQDELARDLGISRTSLREALKELSYRGIIVSRHGHGTFVAENMIGERDTLEARLLLEPGIAYLATGKATDADIAKLEKLVKRMAPHVEARRYEEFSDLDMEFHVSIAAICGNRALERLYSVLKDMMLHQQNFVQRIDGAIDRAYAYHGEITQAIAGHDPEAAETAMRRHLEDVWSALAREAEQNQNKKVIS